MKTPKGVQILTVLLFAVLMVGGSQPALALYGGSESPDGNWLEQQLVPDAKGTRLTGVMTIHQQRERMTIDENGIPIPAENFNEIFGLSCTEADPPIILNYFLRLQKGNGTPYGFSGKLPVCLFDLDAQKNELNTFIQQCVIPIFFPDQPDAPFAWKAVEKIVSEDPSQFPEGVLCERLVDMSAPLFLTMDVVIAVKEKPKHRPCRWPH